jgi:hypothetical protein
LDSEITKYKNIASIVVIAMLLLAIPSGIWPYGYYVFLRWIVAATAGFVLWAAYNLGRKLWMGLMIITAILFNPISPIHFDKSTWVIIDFIVAVLFFISTFKLRLPEKEKE